MDTGIKIQGNADVVGLAGAAACIEQIFRSAREQGMDQETTRAALKALEGVGTVTGATIQGATIDARTVQMGPLYDEDV